MTIRDWENTDHEALRLARRKAFKACGGDHSDWDEYDRVMKEDRRAIVVVKPDHVYGQVGRDSLCINGQSAGDVTVGHADEIDICLSLYSDWIEV